MANKWYISKDGQQSGPFSIEQLRGMVGSGRLAAGDMVWTEGMDQWAMAGQVNVLFGKDVPASGELSYQQDPPVNQTPAGPFLKRKGALFALIVIIVANLALGTYLGLNILGSSNEDKALPGTAHSEQDSVFSPLGYWKGTLKNVLVYLVIQPEGKATILLPWFGEYAEGHYREAGQRGVYALYLYDLSSEDWTEVITIEKTNENTLKTTSLNLGAMDTFTRVSEQEFKAMLPNIANKDPYLSFRAETHTSLLSAFVVFESLVNNPLHSAEWGLDLKVSMALIKVICDNILNSTAPEQYLSSHENLQLAANHYSLAIDSIVASDSDKAKQHLQNGNQHYAEASRLLQ